MALLLPRPRTKPVTPVLDRSHRLARGLVGAWLHPDAGNTLNDLTFTNSPTAINTSHWRRIPSERGFVIDEVSDNQHDLGAAGLGGDFDSNSVSFACWASPDIAGVGTAAECLLRLDEADSGSSQERILLIRRSGNNGLCIQTKENGSNQFANGEPFPAGWHHAALVYDHVAATVTVYLDAMQVAQRTGCAFSAGTYQMNKFQIGFPGNVWEGMLDSPHVWNRALTPDEIAELYADPWGMWRRKHRWIYSADTGGAATDFPFRRYYSGNFGGV